MPADPYRYFRIEAREILDELARSSRELAGAAEPAPIVSRMLRLAHTLKGAARIVKQAPIAEGAHAIEDLLEPHRGGAPGAPVAELVACVDEMSRAVDALPAPDAQVKQPTAAPEPVHVAPPDTGAIDAVLGNLAQVLAAVGRLRANPGADARARLEHVDRELREIREDVERLRLQPASSLFATLERAARDAARRDQRVALEGAGGHLRLDPVVLGHAHRALVQLVRNAVAHGIEPARDRAAHGKPEVGRIAVTVELSGKRTTFTCRDDGRGIDLAAVRRAAGLAPTVGDDAVVQRLFQGGLTTAPVATAHSGRGIGLDVVRDVARELGGTVATETSLGGGTAISLTLPISLAAISALVVEAGGRAVALPLASVRRALLVHGAALLHGADGRRVAYDDVAVPYRALEPLLGLPEPMRGRHPAVVVADGDAAVALAVDRLLGVEEIVLRAPPPMPVEPVVLGFALDDEGVPRVVLDPAAVVAAAARPAPPTPTRAPPSRVTILVVDDSVTTRMLEQSILESAGYHVDLAASAEEALEKAERNAYALFLVDVEMPGMDGFAFVSTIRAHPTLAHIPAILVTSRSAAEDRRRGEAAGAQGYVIKGEFDQVALLGAIRRLVGA
ncbi:MAG: response regulator [Deltaproteobacteria bacterium]|nr:response regulator [Deltaproteobacteria bacterium]